MSQQIFIGLSIIIGVVLVTLGIMKTLKQPMIIGYIIAGTLITIFLPNLLHGNAEFQSFSTLGISFLLFIVGMELNPKIIRELGKTSIIAGIVQVVLTTVIGFGISMALGFDNMTSIYIGAGFAFSSTIVVLKLLSDKDETESTFGRLSIGMLIVQDLIVMLLFIAMAASKDLSQGNSAIVILTLITKIVALGGGLFVIARYLIPQITLKIAESQEYLFLFAIGRCFILGTVFHLLGFGIEIGALIAGITLANSSYRFEITSKIKSLRDFFIVIFFVLLGSQISFTNIGHFILPIIIFSLVVMIIKPIITMLILGYMGHTRKNNFLAGTSLGQISEFSFLLLTMGIATGTIKDPNLLSIITIVGLISIAGSSYFIIYGEKLYHFIRPILKFIPGSRNKTNKNVMKQEYEIILCGYGRFGSNLYDNLLPKHQSILVIDERPGIIHHLQSKGIPCLYGDISDINFLEELNVKNTKMVISTVKKFDENMMLLKTLKENNQNLIFVFLSNHVEESIKLYEQGADYVILPHYIGVTHTSLMLEEYGFDINKFMNHKKSQVHELKSRHKDMMIEALQMGM